MVHPCTLPDDTVCAFYIAERRVVQPFAEAGSILRRDRAGSGRQVQYRSSCSCFCYCEYLHMAHTHTHTHTHTPTICVRVNYMRRSSCSSLICASRHAEPRL